MALADAYTDGRDASAEVLFILGGILFVAAPEKKFRIRTCRVYV